MINDLPKITLILMKLFRDILQTNIIYLILPWFSWFSQIPCIQQILAMLKKNVKKSNSHHHDSMMLILDLYCYIKRFCLLVYCIFCQLWVDFKNVFVFISDFRNVLQTGWRLKVLNFFRQSDFCFFMHIINALRTNIKWSADRNINVICSGSTQVYTFSLLKWFIWWFRFKQF